MKFLITSLFVAGFLGVLGCDQKPATSPPDTANPLIVEPPPLIVEPSDTEPASDTEQSSTTTIDDVRNATSDALETTVAFSKESKDKLMKDLNEQLAIMDENIEKLRLKGQELAGDAKVNWNQTMADLEVKRKSAAEKVTALEASTVQAWDDVSKGAKSAWTELKNAFEEASTRF